MRKLGVMICIFLLLYEAGNSKKRNDEFTASLNQGSLIQINKAKFMEDLFDKKSEIQLELTAESALAYITDLAVDANGNFIICDGVGLNQVWVFSAKGKFLRTLSQRGQGPGEYSCPLSVAISKNKDILINDYFQMKIIFYDSNFKYKKEIKGVRGHFIHLNNKNEIYLYEGMVAPMPRANYNTIRKFSEMGNEILSFAPIPENVIKTRYSVMSDGVDIDLNDYIYEMNPLHYQIRKWTPGGQLEKTFKIPKDLASINKSGKQYIILNGPFCLENGLIVVQRGNKIDCFNKNGDILARDISLQGKIIYARGKDIFVELWEDQEGPQKQNNPRIIIYKFK